MALFLRCPPSTDIMILAPQQRERETPSSDDPDVNLHPLCRDFVYLFLTRVLLLILYP